MHRQASVTPSLAEEGGLSRKLNSEVPVDLRKAIIRIFSKKYGLQLHSSAISFIRLTLDSHGLEESEWDEALEWLAKGLVESAGKGEQGECSVRAGNGSPLAHFSRPHSPHLRLFDCDPSSIGACLPTAIAR